MRSRIIEAARIWQSKPEKIKKGSDVVRVPRLQTIEVKADGHRFLIARDRGRIVASRKRPRQMNLETMLIEQHAHIVGGMRLVPDQSVVEGEVIVRGGEASDVMTALQTPCTNACPLHFIAWAMPFIAGENRTGDDIHEVRNRLDDHGFFVARNVIHEVPVDDGIVKISDLRALQSRLDVEGFVLKSSHYRAGSWIKYRPSYPVDVVILGVKPGTSKYEGLIGSFDFGIWDGNRGDFVKVGNCSGMSDDIRRMPVELVIGRVIELKHDGVMSKGGLRFPQFVRFRDDKDPRECTREQFE